MALEHVEQRLHLRGIFERIRAPDAPMLGVVLCYHGVLTHALQRLQVRAGATVAPIVALEHDGLVLTPVDHALGWHGISC